jgi:amino acid adenylation domain-containing protein/thioester reductase-like protein
VTHPEESLTFAAALDRVLTGRGAQSASPLSAEQRRLWLLGGMAGGSWAAVTARYEFRDPPDVAGLQLRLAALTARHEALRSVFVDVAGRPARLVLPFADVALRVVNMSSCAVGDARSEELIRHLAKEEFSLGSGPLLRSLMLCYDGGDVAAELVLTGHRLVLDQTSMDLLVAQLLRVGEGAEAESQLEAALSLERSMLAASGLNEEISAWGTVLASPAATEIPAYRQRPEVKENDTASVVISLALGPAARAALGDQWGAATAAAWLAVLMRNQASDSAMCGVRVSRGSEWSDVIGPVDPLRIVRLDAAADSPPAELLPAVARQLHQPVIDVPFAHLVHVCPPSRDLSRTPYVQTVVRAVDARDALGGQAGSGGCMRVPNAVGGTEFDLELTAWLEREAARVQIDYDTRLHTGQRVRGLAAQFEACLGALLADGQEPAVVATVPLLARSGLDQAITAGRGEQGEIDGRSLVDLVDAQARATPDAVALRHGRTQMTYRELWADVQNLADEIASRDVRSGDRVAVWLRRSPASISFMLAVLSAGAVYVPVDAAFPEERIRFLLSDSRPSLLLTDGSVDVFGDLEVPVLTVGARRNARPPGRQRPLRVPADTPAYLIYTSGSTGRPKGAIVRHSSVVNNIQWRQAHWPLNTTDRVLHNHSFSFDPAVWAVLWPLATGGSIVLASEYEMADPAQLLESVRAGGVTVLGGVPSMLSLLVGQHDAGTCTGIRLVLSGAEPLCGSLIDRIAATWSASIVNLYGPTEATIDATGFPVPETGERVAPVPIGWPVRNTAVHIVDPEMQLVPDDVAGEIVIGGAGLAVGYHDRPALTASRFLPNPFDGAGTRLYRTGDLGRRLADGSVQFLGRIDAQVKIRGYRIELTEIEAVLEGLPGVRGAAVVILDAGTEHARLAAAVTGSVPSREGEPLAAAAIRAATAAKLPEYLLPDRFAFLEDLPRTPTGKVDRRELTRQLTERQDTSPAGNAEYTAPRTELERAVAEAFAQVLRVEAVDVHADFFAAGGNSLLLARLATLLGTRHDVKIPLHDFFRTPTVAGVAETIEVYRRAGIEGVLSRQHAATLEADGTLAEAVGPQGLPEADWANPSRVLLTGATGYLGLHLLEQLLRRTSATVVCHCRASHPEHALQRIKEGLAHYEIDVSDQLDRVSCVVGDLAEPRLGLTGEQWADLAATVDVIYHNGALVNFVYPYSALKAANVGGTQQVLKLACDTRLKAVHHISTIDTLLATHTPRPFLENDAPLHSAVGVPSGYTGSKWVAEKVLNEARRRGIPVTVFRPGLILGHSGNGATQTINYLLVALRGFLPMRILPDYPRIFDIVPVDYVASAIVHISRQRAALGGFFHLFNPAPVSLRAFCEWIRSYGYEFDIVPFEEGRRRALQVVSGHPLYPLVPLIQDAEVEPHRALDPRHMDEVQPGIECRQTLKLLEGSDIVCLPTTEADAHAILAFLVRTGFMPGPHHGGADGALLTVSEPR